MEILVMVAQMVLGLSILVGLHEFGHMLAAKAFGMRVEKFFIGFPPKVIGKKIGETEYAIGAVPLGGFVKISGMIDESLDTDQMSKEPQPWEFRAKPAWQRLIVMLGGIIMNVITGIVIFTAMTFYQGDVFLEIEEVNKHGIYATPLAEEVGLRTYDQVIAVNGKEVDKFRDLLDPNNLLEINSYYTIVRNGETKHIDLPADLLEKMTDQKDRTPLFSPLQPFNVAKISPNSGASEAGIQIGDEFVSFNGKPVQYFQLFRKELQTHPGEKVQLGVRHEGSDVIDTLTASISAEGTLGFYPQPLLKTSRESYSFTESIPIGTKQAFDIVIVQIKAFNKIFKGEVSASKSVSGPIGMVQFFSPVWDWESLWRITGMLSMVLAFMNLLPIPALDGGHVVFLTYEMITGKKPSDKVLIVAQQLGMIILLTLMVFAFGNDIYNIFR